MSEAILAQWRATRDPMLAEQLRLTVASGSYTRLAPGTDVNAAWDEAVAAHDVERLRVLFLSAVDELDALPERIAKLAALDDPRAVDLAMRTATGSTLPAVKAAMIRLIGLLRDSRRLEWLENYEDDFPDEVREARAALRQKPRVDAKHTRLLRTPGADIESLFDAVYAAPHDLSLRRVLADALIEKGDPRGEFIALQLQPRLDAKQRKLEAELLARYADAWARPLHTTQRGRLKTSTHGFLSVVTNDGMTLPEQSHFAEWATVEHFVSHWPAWEPKQNKAHLDVVRRARGLRSLFWLPEAVELESETVEVLGVRGKVTTLDGFPKLRVLVCRELDADAAIPSVAHFAVVTDDWKTWLARKRSSVETFSLMTDSLPYFPEVAGWQLTCSPGRNQLTWLGKSRLDVPDVSRLASVHVIAPSVELPRVKKALGRKLASFTPLGAASLKKPSFERLGWF